MKLLGFVSDEALPDLYASLDVFALPSINAFEAFGIVQVEGMMAGVPALASNLPGVRVPVQRTGFGVVAEPRDGESVRAGLARLRDEEFDRVAGAQRARELYSLDVALDAYADLFDRASAAARAEMAAAVLSGAATADVRHVRRRLARAALLVTVLTVALLGGSLPAPTTASAASSMTFTGHGFGHGRGLGQYGALATPWTRGGAAARSSTATTAAPARATWARRPR